MAPHLVHSPADAEAGVTSGRSSPCEDRREAEGSTNEAGTMTLRHKVALCAGLMASDAMGVFSNLSEMPLQQTLGTPVYLLTLPGAVSATSALILVPLMGWIADGGSNPRRRKRPITFATFCIGIIGLCLNLSATVLSTHEKAMRNHTVFPAHPENQSSYDLEAPGTVLDDGSEATTPMTTTTAAPTTAGGILDLPLPAILSMLGFVVMDLSFDLTNSATKALVLSHGAPADHVSLLVTGVFMAALGGCFTSVFGLVDLSGLLPGMDAVCSQAMVQLVSLTVLCFLCCTCSLLSATRIASQTEGTNRHRHHIGNDGQSENEDQNAEGGIEDKRTSSVMLPKEGPDNVFYATLVPGEAIMSNTSQLEQSYRSLSFSATLSCSRTSQTYGSDDDKIRILQDSSSYGAILDDSAAEMAANKDHFLINRKFEMFVLWLAAFFSGCSIFTFNVTIADFVGKVVYEGSPQAEADSEDYMLYQEGMRTAALCVLILNIAYVMSALCQNKVLSVLSPTAEYVVVNTALMILMMIMRQTANLVSVYVTSAVVGLNRAALFTVPFVLATQLCCQPAKIEGQPPEKGTKPSEESTSRFGSTMALVTSAVPSAYLVVNCIIGPLVDATGDPSSPMLMAVVCSLLAAVTVCCYQS